MTAGPGVEDGEKKSPVIQSYLRVDSNPNRCFWSDNMYPCELGNWWLCQPRFVHPSLSFEHLI